MAIPQVPEPVRRAPILAIRAVFVGIGRVLMIADRPTPVVVVAERASEAREPQAASAPTVVGQTDDAATVVGRTDGRPAVAGQADSAPDLPLPNYDGLSLASIRARLRGLDVTQLKTLLEYEAANAERADVLGMFERRIEKLEAGS
ncbi:MAG TPA: hypothetical protein VLM11_16550 [Streptosporangiaceae bacterium]|nr:hypothetical protein [Streptosporangiaceae bacterium]